MKYWNKRGDICGQRFGRADWPCSLCAIGSAEAEDASTGYRAMAPLTEYLSTHEADEIALARSAAPASISAKADILTLGSQRLYDRDQGNQRFRLLGRTVLGHRLR